MVSMSKLKGIFFGRYLWITNTISGGITIVLLQQLIISFKSCFYQSWSKGVLLALGDLVQQSIELRNNPNRDRDSRKEYDLERSGSFQVLENFLLANYINSSYYLRQDDAGRLRIGPTPPLLVLLSRPHVTRNLNAMRSEEDFPRSIHFFAVCQSCLLYGYGTIGRQHVQSILERVQGKVPNGL